MDDGLFTKLVGDLAPVRRLRPLPLRLSLWTATALCAVVTPALLVPRPDLTHALATPAFLIELALAVTGAIFLAGIALHAIQPDVRPRRIDVLTAAGVVALIMALGWASPPTASAARPAFACLAITFALGLGPLAASAFAVRRAASTVPATVGALLGSGALLAAYAGSRLHCPLDDRLHLVVGHATPVIVAGVAGSALGSRLLGRWHGRWP